jgi:integrase
LIVSSQLTTLREVRDIANLRGGTLDKQVADAFHFGVKRHGSNDHQTHSDGVANKREMYLRDFKNFMENNQIDGKLNQSMTSENMDKFLEQRMDNLSRTSREDYARGWSSMVQGLVESNVSINLNKTYFDQKVTEIKEMPSEDVITGRAIKDVNHVIKELYSTRYESGVIAEVQYTLGLRVSEAIELVQNYEKYIEQNEVIGLIGKGNHSYEAKEISPQLVAKIALAENIPSQGSYRNDLTEVTDGQHTPHDFRYSYANREYHAKLEDGVEYHQALREVSEGLNHSRESMTLYYMKRV